MSSAVSYIVFNNGKKIPIVGLGTWLSESRDVKDAVRTAISCGYRHIDCAIVYGNEEAVGEAIAEKIEDGTVKRENLFITSKLWNSFHDDESVNIGIRKSLKNLKLDYLDLYLMHWPVAMKSFQESGEMFPKTADGKLIYVDIDYINTWKAMEKLVKEGLVKSIGVSNFNIQQLDRLIANATILPVNQQIEIHPYFTQKPMLEYCKQKGISVTAYCPLGNPKRFADLCLLDDPFIVSLSAKYEKSCAQIALRYQIQNGTIVIPKSVNKARIESNFQLFDFEISSDDMKRIDDLNRNHRINPDLCAKDAPYYPFDDVLKRNVN